MRGRAGTDRHRRRLFRPLARRRRSVIATTVRAARRRRPPSCLRTPRHQGRRATQRTPSVPGRSTPGPGVTVTAPASSASCCARHRAPAGAIRFRRVAFDWKTARETVLNDPAPPRCSCPAARCRPSADASPAAVGRHAGTDRPRGPRRFYKARRPERRAHLNGRAAHTLADFAAARGRPSNRSKRFSRLRHLNAAQQPGTDRCCCSTSSPGWT